MSPLLAPDTTPDVATTVDAILAEYVPAPILAFLAERGTRIVVVRGPNAYHNASPALRRLGAGVDAWPFPPAGLFVVEEATLYVKTISPMTIVHELGHAFDRALGGEDYLSTYDGAIRRAYAAETHYVTPYAASAVDEYFAEAFRAMCEANDLRSLWPAATRARLSKSLIAPIMTRLFARFDVADPDDICPLCRAHYGNEHDDDACRTEAVA